MSHFPVYNGDGTIDMAASMKRAAAVVATEQVEALLPALSAADECDRQRLALAICPELRGLIEAKR